MVIYKVVPCRKWALTRTLVVVKRDLTVIWSAHKLLPFVAQ